MKWHTESTLLHSTLWLSIFLCSLDISCFSSSPSHFPPPHLREEEIIWKAQSTLRVTGRDHKIQIWIRCLYRSYYWHLECLSYSKRPKTQQSWTVHCTEPEINQGWYPNTEIRLLGKVPITFCFHPSQHQNDLVAKQQLFPQTEWTPRTQGDQRKQKSNRRASWWEGETSSLISSD